MVFERNNYFETEMLELFEKVKEKTGKNYKEICKELGNSERFYSDLKNNRKKMSEYNKKYCKERLKSMLD